MILGERKPIYTNLFQSEEKWLKQLNKPSEFESKMKGKKTGNIWKEWKTH